MTKAKDIISFPKLSDRRNKAVCSGCNQQTVIGTAGVIIENNDLFCGVDGADRDTVSPLNPISLKKVRLYKGQRILITLMTQIAVEHTAGMYMLIR